MPFSLATICTYTTQPTQPTSQPTGQAHSPAHTCIVLYSSCSSGLCCHARLPSHYAGTTPVPLCKMLLKMPARQMYAAGMSKIWWCLDHAHFLSHHTYIHNSAHIAHTAHITAHRPSPKWYLFSCPPTQPLRQGGKQCCPARPCHLHIHTAFSSHIAHIPAHIPATAHTCMVLKG